MKGKEMVKQWYRIQEIVSLRPEHHVVQGSARKDNLTECATLLSLRGAITTQQSRFSSAPKSMFDIGSDRESL